MNLYRKVWNPDKRSASGLTGGDAYKMMRAVQENRNICGKIFRDAMTKAPAVSQTNACMGRIVAAPTAGSCGILPSALLTISESRNIPNEDVVMAPFTASAVGMVIANNASIAGAAGGCQAECGAASAMAAAAIVEIGGGTPKMCEHACAIALKNILGRYVTPLQVWWKSPASRETQPVLPMLLWRLNGLAGIEGAIPAERSHYCNEEDGDAHGLLH